MKFASPDQRHTLEIGERRFVFRTPTLADRARLERETIMAGGRRATIFDIMAGLREAVVELLPEGDPDRAAALAAIDAQDAAIREAAAAYRQAGEAERAEAAAALSKACDQPATSRLIEQLTPHWERLRRLTADNAVYPLIRGGVAARLFLVAWSLETALVLTRADGVAENSLAYLGEAELIAIGQFVDDLLQPSQVERKNFVSSPGGGSAPIPSLAASTPSPSAPSTTNGPLPISA